MTTLSRRSLLQVLLTATATSAVAQTNAAPGPAPFLHLEDVVRRARELAAVPYEDAAPPLPEQNQLDFDAYRDIRFGRTAPCSAPPAGRSDAAVPPRFPLPASDHRRQRHPRGGSDAGAVSRRAVRLRQDPIERPLPVNLGFAGFACIFR